MQPIRFGLIKIQTQGKEKVNLQQVPFWLGEQLKYQMHSASSGGEMDCSTVHRDYFIGGDPVATVQVKPTGLLRRQQATIYIDDAELNRKEPGAAQTFLNTITGLFSANEQRYQVVPNAEGDLKDHTYFDKQNQQKKNTPVSRKGLSAADDSTDDLLWMLTLTNFNLFD